MTQLQDIVIDRPVTVHEIRLARRALMQLGVMHWVKDMVIRAHPDDEPAFRHMEGFRHSMSYSAEEMDAAKPNEIGKIDGFHVVMDHRRVPGSILVMGEHPHSVTITTQPKA